jgi:hypothetical protein
VTLEEELEALERRLEGLPERIAARAAPELLQVAQGQWQAGQGPDGKPWPLTRGGRLALVDLTSKITAHADGDSVVLELPAELAYHQAPTQPGHPVRPTVPEDGAELPEAWGRVFADAVAAELEE